MAEGSLKQYPEFEVYSAGTDPGEIVQPFAIEVMKEVGIDISSHKPEAVQKYLNWNEKSKGAVILKKICGMLLILGGVYLIWSAR